MDECRIYTKDGSVASYIPELKNANPENLGICVIAEEDTFYCAGDYKIEFTMQSIAKPIILLLALMDKGEEEVRKLVGVEATGKPFDAFNYSDQALKRDHINPMINAGAIALCTLINGDTYKEKFSRLLNLIRKIAGNPHLTVDEDVYISEKSPGSKNRALAYMLKAYGMISDNLTKSYEGCRMLSKYESLPTEEKADYEANSEEYNKRRMNNLSVCFKEV